MSVDDRARLHLHAQLGDAIGREAADTLMEELGSLGREQLATRADLLSMESRLRAEMAQLRGELTTDMANLRGDLTTDMAKLRGEFGELRGEFGVLRGELAERLEAQTRTLLIAFVGMMASIGGLAFSAARLG